ncbi:hypothetical protein ABIA35_008624 [Catenulispora sp. MAP12-49]|uniref:MAB_1171c family putative transporter n=1 Tax=Catenulispora sp. MAP12-49 TaxID=3156302 RepID=UPI0035114C11
MSDLAAYLAAAALLTFSVYRLSTDRRGGPNQVQRYGYCLMICLAAAMAMLAPATPRLMADAGVDQVAVILLGDSVRTAAISVLMFLACAVAGRPARGLPVVAAAVGQAAGITLFLAARPAIGPDDALVVHGAGRWLLAGHDLVFAGYAAWSLAAATAAFAREARRAGPGPVRTGIRLSLAALAVGMVWTAWTVDDVVHVLRTGIQDGSEDLVSNALGALCAAFIVAATLVAKWHAGYAAVRDRVHTYLVYRRLTPLWEAIRTELPQIALEDDRRLLFSGRSLDFALYRRVIEIHDGRLALRPYAPEHEPGRGRGPDTAPEADRGADRVVRKAEREAYRRADRGADRGAEPDTDREAFAEAASIAAALENRRAGRVGAPGAPVRHTEAARTVAVEAAWLAEVAAAFTRVRKSSDFPSSRPRTRSGS